MQEIYRDRLRKRRIRGVESCTFVADCCQEERESVSKVLMQTII
jgi:hypothetical protein